MLYLQWQDLSACIPDLVLPTTASQSQSGILNALRHLRHLKTTKAPQHLRQLGICAFCTNSRDALLDLQKDSRASTGGTCGNEYPSNRHFPPLCDVLVSEVDSVEGGKAERTIQLQWSCQTCPCLETWLVKFPHNGPAGAMNCIGSLFLI